MRPERLAEIVSDSIGRGNMLASVDDGFRQDAGRDWKAAAQAEATQYFETIHGKRCPAAEKARITSEIEAEHEQRWKSTTERGLGLVDYALAEEVPTLEAHLHECEQPASAAEEYERAVPGAGSPDRPLQLALLEQITRNGLRRELSQLPPSAALALYRGAISGNGVTPDAVVRHAVLIQEIERRGDDWAYDVQGDRAAVEHAASRQLARLIAETRASRVPKELRAALDRAREARKFADRLRQIHKLRPVSPTELFGETGVDERYAAHPKIAEALRKRKGK